MRWWQKRENATLRIVVADGKCTPSSSLKDAAFEKYPGEFLKRPVVSCKKTKFSGEVWLTIDSTLEKKELLIELLKREGILNFQVAKEGEFLLSHDKVGALLEKVDAKLRKRGRLFETDIAAIKQVIIDKLAERGLPLLRIWYHPKINDTIIKAVFSPRYDVDRAITNLARIRKLEQKYEVTSTLYIRAFCPFYSDKDVQALASSPWCSEIGLHGEFVRNSQRYGDEFSAARAEKEHLEKLIGRPVTGVCLHGGELTSNLSDDTLDALERAGFLYDTTTGLRYHFPVRTLVNGRMRNVYCLKHVFGDNKVPPTRDYARNFYEKVMEKMDKVHEQNGVFVLILHPVYFGFFSYLLRPKNFTMIVKFFWNNFKQSPL